jgi:hypothetical protein
MRCMSYNPIFLELHHILDLTAIHPDSTKLETSEMLDKVVLAYLVIQGSTSDRRWPLSH